MKARALIWATAEGKQRMPALAAEHGLDRSAAMRQLIDRALATD
jgi:hypothetical protein